MPTHSITPPPPGISTPSRPSGHVRHDSNSSGGGSISLEDVVAGDTTAADADISASLSRSSSRSSMHSISSSHSRSHSRTTSLRQKLDGKISLSSPSVPAPCSPNTALPSGKSQSDFSGFTPGGPVPVGYTYLGRSASMVTSTRRNRPTGLKSASSPHSALNHTSDSADEPIANKTSRRGPLPATPTPAQAIAQASAAAVHGEMTAQEAAAAMTGGNRVNAGVSAKDASAMVPAAREDDRLAAMASVLPVRDVLYQLLMNPLTPSSLPLIRPTPNAGHPHK